MLPLECNEYKITSNYGERSFIYRGELINDFHYGIDLRPEPRNNECPVIAFADGEVVKVQKRGKQYGKPCYVRIKHNNGYYTLYYHLKDNSIKVNVGDHVSKGQILGIIGATGMATGVHLHFQIDKGTNKSAINPLPFILGEENFKTEEVENTEEFSKGDYKTLSDLYVRYGAGTIYPKKLVKDLTPDGRKKACYNNDRYFAIYKKGIIFTALDIINNKYGVWAKTPSGYVCIKGQSGRIYCKKCEKCEKKK